MSKGIEHSEEVQRRGRLVIRTVPILLIPLLAIVLTFMIVRLTMPDLPEPTNRSPVSPLLPIVVLIVFLSALVLLVRLGRPTLSALVLISVWTMVTTLVSLRVGINSYVPALLILPMTAAGLLIDRIAALSLALLATILVASMGWLQWTGQIVGEVPPDIVLRVLPLVSVGFWVALFWAVALLTSMLAGGLQQALHESRSRAEALRTLTEQLEQQVQQKTAQLLDQEREAATLEERARLARDIHDTLAQSLTGIVVQLGAAQRAMQAAPVHAPEHVALAQQLAKDALAEARRSVWNLRTPALDHGSLIDALRALSERPLRPDLSIVVQQLGDAYPLPTEVESQLVRVAQEALANSAKHSQARHVQLMLLYQPTEVGVTIRDNGAGFPAAVFDQTLVVGPWGGFGVRGMRERLASIGGRLVLSNDQGAVVQAWVPRQVDKKVAT